MRYAVVSLLVATLLMASLNASAEVPGDGNRLPVKDTELIGDMVWSHDIRVTYNPADDTLPQVTADDEQRSHVVWQRSGMWTRTFDHTGMPMSKEVFISPHAVRGYGDPDRYPLGPSAAIDSYGNIHVTWDDGWQNVFYEQFDAFGNVLVETVHVGAEDNIASHVPSIAVDPINEHIHIVHEDYQYQCEDIVYNKLDRAGKLLVNAVPVSNDASSHCEHSTLTADAQGSIHVAFGTYLGPMHRRVDRYGVARWQSVRISGGPAYTVPDIAATANGEVHAVWEENETILYSRLDQNGTVLNERVTISQPGFPVGPPRIAAGHDELAVYIVWHDYSHGAADVLYAKLSEGSFGTTPPTFRLTDDPASSCYPRVTVDPDDNVHVVWQDDRDGNWEIYYKFMYNYKMKLGVANWSPYPYFFHPNDTRVLHWYLENRGDLVDDYRLTLDYDDWAEEIGWSLRLNETLFNDVRPRGMAYFSLTTTSPVKASEGDSINVSLTATSLNSLAVNKTYSWRSFIIVEKEVRLSCAEPTKLIDPGGSAEFRLNIVNTGDVPDSYLVEYTLLPEDRGWSISVDVDRLVLDADGSREVTFVLQAPEGARTDASATVFVRVQSTSDKSVWDGKKLMGLVNPTFHIEMEVVEDNKWVMPGGEVEFPVIIRNVGNMHGEVSIYLTSSTPMPGWGALLGAETISLSGGDEVVVPLTVTASPYALAGFRQVIEVNAISEDFLSSGYVEVTALVGQVHRLNIVEHGISPRVHAGSRSPINVLSVMNDGNGMEIASLSTGTMPPGWIVDFERKDVRVGELVLLAKESRSVSVILTLPYEAVSGRYSIPVVVRDSSGQEYTMPMPFQIQQRFGLDLSTLSYNGEGPPGSTVTYRLTLVNEGNGEDEFTLGLEGLPGSNWLAGFHDLAGRPTNLIALGPGERGFVDLWVTIPLDATVEGPMDLVVKATSKVAEMDEVKVTLEVLRPDLSVLSVGYYPSRSIEGETTRITVTVENAGDYRADHVMVRLLEGGVEVDHEYIRAIHEGGTASVIFSWIPSPGLATLTYQVSCDLPEHDYDNNELVHRKSVISTGDDGRALLWFVILSLVALVIILFLVRGRVRVEDVG